jgi:predicted ABC-type sugar transport system permease subunit
MDKGPNTSAGSLLYMVDGKRQLKAYVLTEDNLDSLSVLDSIFNICLAVGSALLSFAGGIFLSLSLAGNTVPENIKLPWNAFFVVCLALGLVCAYFCNWSLKKRKGSIQKIKEETKHGSE